jgi:hypothetical protein
MTVAPKAGARQALRLSSAPIRRLDRTPATTRRYTGYFFASLYTLPFILRVYSFIKRPFNNIGKQVQMVEKHHYTSTRAV